MEPVYILIKVDVHGRLQASVTNVPDIPEMFILPGEVAFTVSPADWAVRHTHESEAFITYQGKDLK